MGDVVDMMIDGTLCESCGVYIGPEVGYPRKCSECEGPLSKKVRRRREAANRARMTDQQKWQAMPEIPVLEPVKTKCVRMQEPEE